MENISLRNRRAISVRIEAGIFYMEIPIKASYIADYETYRFLLMNRYTNEDIYLTFEEDHSVDEYTICKVTLNPEEYTQMLQDGVMWDLYVERENEGETKRARISNPPEHLQYHSYFIPGTEKVFYPYRTGKGNISFRVNDYVFFANLEEVHLKKSGVLHFSGSINYAPLYQSDAYKLEELKLVVTNNLNEEEELTFPLQFKEREDLADKYEGNELLRHSGFEGVFDITPHVDLSDKKFLKFYVELTYSHNGEPQTIRSIRMRHLKKDSTLPASVKTTINGKKYKMTAKLTKKSKFLSVQTSEYFFIRESISRARRKWVNIRRGRFLKNSYQQVFKLFGAILPVDKKLMVYESFLGKQYSDNPRAIYEYMREHYPEYKMYWSSDRRAVPYFETKDVPYVRRFSIRWLFLMTRARYWVSNSRLPLWIPKPDHTIYLQTWHGTPLKRLAADMDEVHMPGTNTEAYKRNFLFEASKWDYLVSPNAYSSEIFARAFGFEKDMLETGYPRNDFLYTHNKPENIEALKKSCGLSEEKKIILYAPTWRDNQFYQKGKYKFDLELDLERMRQELGDEYIVVLRLHYLVAENLDLSSYEGFAYDFSKHEDIRELYLMADMLITDYSSVFFDYANLRRPMMFFVYDLDDYRDNLRGFYFDFEETAPGPLLKQTEQIIQEVKRIDREGYQPDARFEAFYNRFCYLEDGKASERVVKQVIK